MSAGGDKLLPSAIVLVVFSEELQVSLHLVGGKEVFALRVFAEGASINFCEFLDR